MLFPTKRRAISPDLDNKKKQGTAAALDSAPFPRSATKKNNQQLLFCSSI
jgi:hypothetical protein